MDYPTESGPQVVIGRLRLRRRVLILMTNETLQNRLQLQVPGNARVLKAGIYRSPSLWRWDNLSSSDAIMNPI